MCYFVCVLGSPSIISVGGDYRLLIFAIILFILPSLLYLHMSTFADWLSRGAVVVYYKHLVWLRTDINPIRYSLAEMRIPGFSTAHVALWILLN